MYDGNGRQPLQIYEFDQLLRARFHNQQCTHQKHEGLPKQTRLLCRKCGWVAIFTTANIEQWTAETKGGLLDWLCRHESCTGTFGTERGTKK